MKGEDETEITQISQMAVMLLPSLNLRNLRNLCSLSVVICVHLCPICGEILRKQLSGTRRTVNRQ